MHGLEEASASQIRQPWRVIAIGAVGQRPRVFLMCAWVRPLVRVPRGARAARGGLARRARGRGRDDLDPHLLFYLQPGLLHKLYERVVASYLRNAHLEEGDKRWTGLSWARCATQSTRS
jgi:hypothetical protein